MQWEELIEKNIRLNAERQYRKVVKMEKHPTIKILENGGVVDGESFDLMMQEEKRNKGKEILQKMETRLKNIEDKLGIKISDDLNFNLDSDDNEYLVDDLGNKYFIQNRVGYQDEKCS